MDTQKNSRAVIPDAALRSLKRKLGDCVLTDERSRFRASVDNLRLSFMPDLVIRVRRPEQVGAVLRTAHQYAVPVTCRGAGSSPTGAAVPVNGGWVLDLSRLRKLNVDPVARMVRAEAGVITAELQSKVEAMGLFFPPDPSSKQYSTLGGNIACNAGGMRCVKYGVTRDYVLGLEGFLADGTPVEWGGPLKKYVSGLNLKDLWIGSEGTLGVVTACTLRLIQKPACCWTSMYAFADEDDALSAVVDLFKAGFNPSICEFLDRQSVACAEAYTGRRVFEGHASSALLLIELDGDREAVAAGRQDLSAFMKSRALAHRSAGSEAEAEAIWQVRRTCSQSMYQLADTKLNEDVVVPIQKQAALVRYTLELRDAIGLATPTFGHAGDGNLHVHIMYNRSVASETRKAKAGINRLMKKVVDLGGVITGEHGVGLAKSPFMKLQHSKGELAAMRAVKNAMDPKGILNPGKVFEPFEVWKYKPVDVTFPWDHR